MRVASINIYVGNRQLQKDIRFIRSLNLDVIGIQEASYDWEKIENALPGFDRFGPGDAADGNAAKGTHAANDCTTYLRKSADFLGASTYRISEAVIGDKLAPARWLTVVRFNVRGTKVAFFNVHLNAAIQSKDGAPMLRLKRVRLYREAMKEIEEEIKSQVADGFEVIIVGDFNYRKYNIAGFKFWKWSPYALFDRNKLTYIARGLDYVAWSKGLANHGTEEIPTSKHGSDHSWLVADIRPKKKLTA